MDDKDIDFVARYYNDDIFSPDTGWRKIKSTLRLRRKRYGIAAAVAAIIAVSATAAIIGYEHYRFAPSHVDTAIESPSVSTSEETRVLAFDNISLTEVVEIVEAEYSIVIENIPENSDDYVLTLRFEGTPSELIEAINEILGTQLIVSAK